MKIPFTSIRIVRGETEGEAGLLKAYKGLEAVCEAHKTQAERHYQEAKARSDENYALRRSLDAAQLDYQKLEAQRSATAQYRDALERTLAEKRNWRQIREVFSGIAPDHAVLRACVAIVDDRLRQVRALAEKPSLPANEREHAAGGASWLSHLRDVLLDTVAEARTAPAQAKTAAADVKRAPSAVLPAASRAGEAEAKAQTPNP